MLRLLLFTLWLSFAEISEQTQVCDTSPVDIIFLLDCSSSVSDSDFQKVLTFLENQVNDFTIGPSNILVAVYTFSDNPHYQFSLSSFQDKASLLTAIRGIKSVGGLTYTGKALEEIKLNGLKSSFGARPGVRKVVVVITDGVSIRPDNTRRAAAELHSLSVDVFAIGIGSHVNMQELGYIASLSSYVFAVPDYQALHTITNSLKHVVCVTPSVPPPQECGVHPVDIIILLDSSDSVRLVNFQKELDFVARFVQKAAIGSQNVQVGLFTFSDDVHFQFALNSYHDSAAMLTVIRQVRYTPGGTYTGKALDRVRTFGLTASFGARAGVRKVVIVITDGASTIPPNTQRAASELHKLNVEVFAIGVGQNVYQTELNIIALSPQNVFMVGDFQALLYMQKRIMGVVCNVPSTPVPTQCGTTPADIAFLLDCSSSVKEINFQKERDFMKQFVMDSKIGANHIQVAAFVFSDNPVYQFSLNTYHDKQSLQIAIQNIKYIGGMTNTDKALDEIGKHIFQSAFGGRPGIAKNVVVLTDGASNQPHATLRAAKRLHDAYVKVFSIGIGNQVNQGELLAIASERNNTFLVPNFDALKKIEKTVIHTICTTPKPLVCGITPADIVFLLDASTSISDADFKIQLNFIMNLINDTKIGTNNAQVGVVTFATDVHNQFWMNDHLDKASLRQAVRLISQSGGFTYTGKALRFARTDAFNAAHGARPNVQKTLIIITDGQSIDAAQTAAEAALVHNMGIRTIAIAVGGNTNPTELAAIATNQHDILPVPDYSTLIHIKQQLFRRFCTQSSF